MPDLTNIQIPAPANWQDFERLCRDLWSEIWNDPGAQLNGRGGQPQHGIDVFGQKNGRGIFHGLQCKGKTLGLGRSITIMELEREVEKAKLFVPQIGSLTLLTTGPNDARLQKRARMYTKEHEQSGLFSVAVLGWSEICAHLSTHTEVARKHFPFLFSMPEETWDQDTAHTESIASLQNVGKVSHSDTDSSALQIGSVYVNREELEPRLFEEIDRHGDERDGRWISIVGEAGHGKSSLIWRLASDKRTIVKNGYCLAAQLLGNDALALARIRILSTPNALILLDTLDLLLLDNQKQVERLIADARANGSLIITTSRPAERRQMNIRPDRELMLTAYSETECLQAIGTYVGAFYSRLTRLEREEQINRVWTLLDGRRSVQELNFEPLILSMIFQTYAPRSIPKDVNTQKVYDHYLTENVEGDRSAVGPAAREQRLSVCLLLANELSFGTKAGDSDTLLVSDLARLTELSDQALRSVVESLVSSGVLQWTRQGRGVRFFHQTFFEYLAAVNIRTQSTGEFETIVSELMHDVEQERLFRVPILKQVAVQDYFDRSQRTAWESILRNLRKHDTILSLQLSIEICGKIEWETAARDIVVDWISSDKERYVRAVLEGVRTYPSEATKLACELLMPVARTSESHSVITQVRKRANQQPHIVLPYAARLAADIKHEPARRSWVRDVILVLIQEGVTKALDAYEVLLAGEQSKAKSRYFKVLQGISGSTIQHAIADFCRSTMEMAFTSSRNTVSLEWANLYVSLIEHDAETHRPEIADNLVARRDLWRDNQRKAHCAGRIVGLYVKGADLAGYFNLLRSESTVERIFAASVLMHAPMALGSEITVTLSESAPTNSMEQNLIWNIVAGRSHDAAESLWNFLMSTAWPKSVSGPKFVAIFSSLAALRFEEAETWLLGRLDSVLTTADTTVFGKQILYAAFGAIDEKPNGPVADRLMQIHQLCDFAGVDIHCPFVSLVGRIADHHPDVADRVSDDVLMKLQSRVCNSLIRGLHNVVRTRPQFVIALWDRVFYAAGELNDEGLLKEYLEVLRNVPRDQSATLMQKLDATYNADRIGKCSDSMLEAVLTLCKVFAEAQPEAAFSIATRSWRPVAGVAGAQGTVYANLLRATQKQDVIDTVFIDIQRTILLAKSQRRVRNSLIKILPELIEHLGTETLKEFLVHALPEMGEESAIFDVIRALERTKSWSSHDSFDILESGAFSDRVRSLVVA